MISMFKKTEKYSLFQIAKTLEDVLGEKLGVERITVPPAHITGDVALSFESSKQACAAARAIAKQPSQFIAEAKTEGPFVNLIFNKDVVYQEVLANVQELGEQYGESDINAGKKAFIEYSSPNIAKPIGIGHLRSTIIGEALVRIYQNTGYEVFRENHLGDWGTQFGKLIYAYEQWGDKKKIKENPIKELKELYVRFQKESEKDERLNEEARSIFKRLEEGDPKLLKLWNEFRDLSVKEFQKVYKRLNVVFDHIGGESQFVKGAGDVVKTCLKKNICKQAEGDGAVVAELSNIPSFLLRKQDGSTLYLTRDLVALKHRIEKFKPDTLVYVVGNEQTLHFIQLFELARRLNYISSTDVKHISFGMVLLEGKRMSTRKGTLVELEDVMDQAVEKANAVIAEKSPNLSFDERKDATRAIGIGAVFYNDLRQSRTRNISFNWERMLNLESGSAVYLQYTYARIESLAAKARKLFGNEQKRQGIMKWENETEFKLAKQIMFFPSVMLAAQKRDAPNFICSYLEALAQTFNSFYNSTSVIKTENVELRDARVCLACAVGLVIKKGLDSLNIKVPEKM